MHLYLLLVDEIPILNVVISGLIRQSAKYILVDPYANAFKPWGTFPWQGYDSALGRYGYVATWNYELDSACYFIRMMYIYWKSLTTNCVSPKSNCL